MKARMILTPLHTHSLAPCKPLLFFSPFLLSRSFLISSMDVPHRFSSGLTGFGGLFLGGILAELADDASHLFVEQIRCDPEESDHSRMRKEYEKGERKEKEVILAMR